MQRKQVHKTHYRFSKYVHKRRWMSMWHQLDEVVSLEPDTVLEVGPGPGLFKAMASAFGVTVETLDLDPELNPDHVGSATNMPFDDNSYDLVCAFQMLEHLPFEESRKAFREMVRVAKDKVIISLPDAKVKWPCSFHLPRIGTCYIHIPKPSIGLKRHRFDGEHYWEINKAGHRLKDVVQALQSAGDARLLKTYRVPDYPYHRFFVFNVRQNKAD